MGDVPAAVSRIERDFTQGEPPFDEAEFPEKRLVDTLSLDTDEDKLQAISLFSTLDYNRDANQLVDKILELRDSNLLDPEFVASNEKYVRESFDDVAFRYRNRDADAWHKNCSILVEKYNGRWHELLLDVSCDAPSLVERLKEDDLNCLKGVKIAPMYARIIDDEVCDLHNIWDLDIPVDTHIRRLSRNLFGSPEMNDDTIRAEWRDLAVKTDISRHVVDGALWHIGNKWVEWGKEYWEEVTD